MGQRLEHRVGSHSETEIRRTLADDPRRPARPRVRAMDRRPGESRRHRPEVGTKRSGGGDDRLRVPGRGRSGGGNHERDVDAGSQSRGRRPVNRLGSGRYRDRRLDGRRYVRGSPIDGGDPDPEVGQIFHSSGGYGPAMATLQICSVGAGCTGDDDGRVEIVEADGTPRTIWQQEAPIARLDASFGNRPTNTGWPSTPTAAGNSTSFAWQGEDQEMIARSTEMRAGSPSALRRCPPTSFRSSRDLSR